MSLITVGTTGRVAFALPINVQTTTSAVLGIRGSGKTTTAAVIVEELLAAGHQTVIVDPTDVWWGLRTSADGKAPGLPIAVCGGDHGQVPLAAGDGTALAELVATERYSLVLSLRHLRKGEQRHFVTDFAETLYHAKGRTRSPLLVVLDECDAFIPQRVGGAESRMVGAIEDLVRRGRTAGIGVCLISQRAASVNKDVLTQIELLVAHRHTSPQDRKALEAWVEAHDVHGQRETFMHELAALDVGAAWFWSPAWLKVFARVAVRRRKTYDSSATPTGASERHVPAAVADVDLEALRSRLAATVQAAEENDPRKLRERIAALEARPAVVDEEEIARAVAAAVLQRDAEWTEKICEWRGNLARLFSELGDNIRRAIGAVQPPDVPAAPAVLPPAVTPPRQSMPAATGALNAYQRDLLAVLLDRSPVPTPRGQLGGLAGRSIKSSAFAPNLRALVAAGYAAETGRGYVATPAAQRVMGDHRPPPRTGRAALDYWLGRLPAYEASLLRVIAEAYPKAMGVDVIANRSGRSSTSSAFMPALRNLMDLGHVESDAGGHRAARHFFD